MIFKRSTTGLTPAERRIVRLVSAIQFITVLDFQMVMPLGADFARDLHMAASNIGWVTGAYTAAAFVAGIVGARFLNRVDRRRAMAFSLWGLVIATALGGLSINYATLIGSRVLAGLFSGPAVSLSYAILSDCVPEERRGRALGRIAAIYSVAGIIGLPIGLKLAEWGSWRTPFFSIAALGVVLIPFLMMAIKRSVATAQNNSIEQIQALMQPRYKFIVMLALVISFISVGGNFLLVPSGVTYLQLNLGYPRENISLLYLTGGSVTFFTLRLTGRLIDRFGSVALILLLTPAIIAVYYFLFIDYNPLIPIIVLFVLSGVVNSARYTIVSTETSKVPPPSQRPGFMSLMSAGQALGQSLGAFTSSLILTQAAPDQPLLHIARAAILASLLAASVPPLLIWLARLNRRRAGFAPVAETLI